MLIHCPRIKPGDMRHWVERENGDSIHGRHKHVAKMALRTMTALQQFTSSHCYASVSWGKDSVVLADFVVRANRMLMRRVPLVWVRVEPIFNPDCLAVRDYFLERHDIEYHEITVECSRDARGVHATGTLERGFAIAVERLRTTRYMSGLRAEESGVRHLGCARFGEVSKNTCRPLAWWTQSDIFGWLAHKNLPVHPVYAMNGGGRWHREHLRVSSLGGDRGAAMGRAEWEREYYGDVLARIEAQR